MEEHKITVTTDSEGVVFDLGSGEAIHAHVENGVLVLIMDRGSCVVLPRADGSVRLTGAKTFVANANRAEAEFKERKAARVAAGAK